MFKFEVTQEWLDRQPEEPDGGVFACSPEIYKEMLMSTALYEAKKPTLTYRKIVMPEDLNPAHRLFGGRIMQWADEAAALYAMCQLQTKQLVTLKVTEILFKEPVQRGDFLEFYANVTKAGTSSLTVHLEVSRKIVEAPQSSPIVLSCDFVFVTIDENGKAIPHRFAVVNS